MASFVRAPKSTQCLTCLHRIVSKDLTEVTFPFYRQMRGKKKSTKQPGTINVKLLEDIPGYGRQGSIIPVVPGRMRNIWYPRQKAEYMTESKLRQLNKKDVVMERDYTFGIEQPERRNDDIVEDPSVVDVEMKLLRPQRATEIISTALPSHLEFYRSPIASPEPEAPQEQPQVRPSRKQATSGAAADLAAVEDSMTELVPEVVSIYGSVSTADIAESIKAILAETEDGARVVLSPEDITILNDESLTPGAEADRIKALGDYDVDIRVKGGEAVRRSIIVKAQQSQ